VWLTASLLALCATLAPTERSAAQVSSIFLDRWDLGFSLSRTSARLDAMGQPWVALVDESREINLWDYGGNVAGFIDDRDAWTGDFWARTRDVDRRTGSVGSSGEIVESGVQLSFRSFERALGIEGNLTVGRDEQGGGGDKRKFTGPDVSLVGNQAIGESAVVGVGLRLIDEEEKTTSNDPLAIEHDTSRTDLSVGLAYYVGTKLDLGASATFTRNRTTGVSEDGLHRDQYDWDRPSVDVGVQVVYGAQSSLQGGAFYRYSRLDGGEELDISWSREFFLNPSGVDLSIRVPLVKEELKQSELGTRWLVAVSDIVDIGAAVSYLSGTYDASVDATFPSISRSADEEFTSTTLNAGLAVHPVSGVSLAGQIDVGERELDGIVFDAPQTTTSNVTGFGGGLEYFVRPYLALRGGFRFQRDTEDVELEGEVTSTEFEETRILGGVGWAPSGGIFLLDMAIGFSDGESTDSAVRDETNGILFTLTGRTLFR
jgi:hypothetical protein